MDLMQAGATHLGRQILEVLRRLTPRRVAILFGAWALLVVLGLVGWALDWVWLAIAAGIPAVFFPFALASAVVDEATRPRRPPLVERVDAMAAALREAADLVDELETEIVERTASIERIRADLERYEHLVEIRSDEAKAVADSIRLAMRDEARRSFPVTFAVNIALMIAGAALGAYFGAVFFN